MHVQDTGGVQMRKTQSTLNPLQDVYPPSYRAGGACIGLKAPPYVIKPRLKSGVDTDEGGTPVTPRPISFRDTLLAIPNGSRPRFAIPETKFTIVY